MFYKDIEKLSSAYFKRLTRAKREVFEKMFEVLNQAKANSRKHPTCGTLPKLSNAGKLYLLLMYLRIPDNALKKQKLNYSGKKKHHTQKNADYADKSSRKILYTAFDKGLKHDFRLFKNSKVYLKEATICLADTDYQGLLKLHKNSELSEKKSKKHPLTK